MEQLYFSVTNSDVWQNQDPWQFLYNYFITEGAFRNSLLIAVAIAVVGILLFYAWIGMAVPKLASLPNWIISFVVVGALTFCLTQTCIIGSRANQTGVFSSIVQKTQQDLSNNIVPDEQVDSFNQASQQLQTTLDQSFNEVALQLDLFNTLYALLIFFLLSLCVKSFTKYCIAIPF